MKKKLLSIMIAAAMLLGTVPAYADYTGEYMTPVAYTSGPAANYTTPPASTQGASANYTTPSASTQGARQTTTKQTTPTVNDLQNNTVPSYMEYFQYKAKLFTGMSSTQKKLAKTIFTAVRKSGNTTKVNLGTWNLSKKEMQKVIAKINNVYFPFEGTLDYYFLNTSGKMKLVIYPGDIRSYIRKNSTYIQKCKNIVSGYVPFNGTTKDKVLGIENGVCKHMRYSLSHSISRAINSGTGACDMYSYIFAGACLAYHIPCMFIGGDADAGDGEGWGGHAWNRVLIGSTWYYADATWVDTSGMKTYKLSKKLWKDHRLEKNL